MRKKKKSDKYTTLILILILLVGLSLLLYPSFSEQWNAMHQTQLIDGYTEQVQSMDSSRYDAIWSMAREYNGKLLSRNDPYGLPQALAVEYLQCLNVYDNGLMGYLEIPVIDCLLSIYHGVDEAVLQTNVGHIEWSSLPVGGESSHCVLSGHRGLPSAELLTNIDHLEIGDVFYLHVLDEKLTYVVDDIAVVLPDETERLQIVEGKDYVTLVTCTPYGINSHRLLVRGERVNIPDAEDSKLFIPNEVYEINKALPIIVGGLLLLSAGFLLWWGGKCLKNLRSKRKMVTDYEAPKTD